MSDLIKATITGTGIYVPERRLTNADLEKMVDTSDEWITSRTGMKERRIAAEGEYSSTMGIHAARAALKNAGKDPEEIDLIAVATCTPDNLFPSTAAYIQKELGCVNAPCFDFQAACTGFLYGLAMVKALVEGGTYKNVLLIASEKISSLIDYEDRATCILFGDGAAAAVISSKGPGLAIEHVKLGTDGHYTGLLSVPAGGSRMPTTQETVAQKKHTIHMESGGEVFKHAVRRMDQVMSDSLEDLGMHSDQIKWLVPHQANARIIQAIAKRFGVPMERVYLTVHKYGNTSASSIPIALHELTEEHTIEVGDYLMAPAFGAGLTWGNAILQKVR